jgi:hypothetical protein
LDLLPTTDYSSSELSISPSTPLTTVIQPTSTTLV